ncbi:putative membrane protein [Camellia lanceoleosa]|uniref:Membrane protein n=1 Tax=Camellia lanceoleosa TaxID=1840588 RepID=A0ACC0I7W5_9ERIC|nr:putative membrane protein [Camellia lanceoleosa]
MNDLSNALREQDKKRHCWSCKPIPRVAILVLVLLFLLGLFLSIFILVVVHNAAFFLCLLSLSSFVASFLLWNTLNWRRKADLLLYLHSFPDSDLRFAPHAHLVKITGIVMCGSASLESSYEKASRCIYTSTILYEYGELGLKPVDDNRACFQWRLAYSERFSTDFYITDSKSGIRALVKAGPDCKVIPLIIESRLVTTTRKCNTLSTHLRKWLRDRNLSAEARLLRLEEGYVKEGSVVSVIGMLHRNNDIVTIVQPPELISTGCLWKKLLLPIDVDGLIMGPPRVTGPLTDPNSVPHLQQ